LKAVTAAEMREIDQKAASDYGLSGIVLMENAGLKVAQAVVERLGSVKGRTVTIFTGKGNNGGDGLVAARHLFNMGAEVKVLMLSSLDKVVGDARTNLEIWQKIGQKVYTITEKDDFNAVRLFLVKTDIIVDAVYGTGFKGKVRDYVGRIIESVNASGKPVISVDIPSGLNADNGSVSGPCIAADQTITFGLPKIGLLVEPGASLAGELRVVDISLPGVLLDDNHIKYNLTDGSMVGRWLPFRGNSSHKGNYGRILIISGSRGLAGAACLTAEAAARSGAGLVTLGVPDAVYIPVAAKLTEVMVTPLPDTESGTLSRDALPKIRSLMENVDVLALGPGLSVNPETVEVIREISAHAHIPAVIDADGLNALAGNPEILKQVKQPIVLTPHPGEMARLAGVTTRSVQQGRLNLARSLASAWKVVLVLKGAGTITADPEENIYINPTGNPGMATGGSGDVLTGIIAGLMAQGVEAAWAAAAGVYLHGLAGDLAAKEKGMMGLIAGDILDVLPMALNSVEKSR